MKKIFCLLLSLLVLSGCANGNDISTFMIMKNTDMYSLYDTDGELQTELTFMSYEENFKRGYLVTNKENQQAYIDYDGDIIVDYGEYDRLQFSDKMVIGTKVVEEKKDNQTIRTNIYYIIDDEGKVLYSTENNNEIYINNLPIIVKDGIYEVLYLNGETLYADEYKVDYAIYDDNYSVYVVGTDSFTDVFYYVDNEKKCINVELSGNFVISDVIDEGALLYDKSLKTVIYVDLINSVSYIYKNINASQLYFSASKNIVIENGTNISLLSANLDKPLNINSYYKNTETYVKRSKEVYGPHSIYQDGKLQCNLTDCQFFPAPVEIAGSYFPVYVKDGGYQFYGFDGKQPFSTTYYDAGAFDINGRAIVKDGATLCYLINESGLAVTKNYYDIKYISSSYYAAYNKDGNFGIIDKDGNVILAMGYTTLPENCIFYYDGKEYIMVEKYGRTYVYNASDEYKEVFSVEGDTVFNEKGYYIVNNDSYYTFDGELIH